MHLKPAVRIVIVGHVDHGKSTVIGRLLYDTDSLSPERYREIEAACKALGRPFEFAYFLDALEEERRHGLTIDTSQTFFKSSRRRYVIIDAPGHKEFLKNMVTGAAAAEAAILLVDAREGVQDQTRRHAHVLSLLGLQQVVVAVNKLDQVGFRREQFEALSKQARTLLDGVGIAPREIIPISARHGDNVAHPSGRTPWYRGPTLLQALDGFPGARQALDLPLRFPVQDVYVWEGKRIYVGRVETGTLEPGMPVLFSPSGKSSAVASLERWPGPEAEASAGPGESVGITLRDELFIERGEIMGPPDRPVAAAREIEATVFWLGDRPLLRGRSYLLKLTTAEATARLSRIHERVDSLTLAVTREDGDQVESPEVAHVTLSLPQPIAAEVHSSNPFLGRFVLVDQGRVSGGGIVNRLGDGAASDPGLSQNGQKRGIR